MENKRSAIVRWGLTFGLIMAFLGSISTVGSRLLEGSLISGETMPEQFLPTAGVALLVGCGLDLVYLALFFVAGIMTARQTGGVGAASLAGLLAGGVGALVNSAISVALLIVFPTTLSSLNSTSSLGPDTTTLVIVSVVGAIFGIAIWGGLGAGLAALGGLIGQNQFRAAHPELAQPYAYAPYAGYPPAPPVGAYPPPPPGAYPSYPAYPPYAPPPTTPYPPVPPVDQPPQGETYSPPDAFPPAQPGQ